MSSETLELSVDHPRIDSVQARFEAPATPPRAAVLLAHGSGLHMDSPFQEAIAAGLLAQGFSVLRFNYPYRELALREGKNRPPDRAPVLEAVHEQALLALRERSAGIRVVLAGKSLGGRISTHLAAKDESCSGLVLLGYPLHPAGKPEKLRHEHFPAIVQPALFLQGTRDALCDLALLRSALQRFGGRATLEVIEDADHSFHVRKSSGRDDAGVLKELLSAIDTWERSI